MIYYAHEVILIVAGAVLFVLGFRKLREKWLIDNTPSSKIRSVAMGLSEIKGTARKKFGLLSRLTRAECVYFKFTIEREVRDSKGRASWKTIEHGESTNYFYVEDETGKILVDPLNAEVVMDPDYRVVDVQAGRRMRYTEWYICPADQVYVLGTVRKFQDNTPDRKDKLLARLKELKEDKKALMQFDADGDGQISVEEWDKAVEAVNDDILREELRNPAGSEEDLVVAQGDIERTFILSDKSENQISSRFFLTSAGFVIIGVVLIAWMSVSIILKK
jgi:hypothetical protein